ncbi:MAG TPA: SDR family oxidoreductase [Acidimicrobiales bacterium]|nr:SDR family oxidoreductase [Acidimicrobiales bacterium]
MGESGDDHHQRHDTVEGPWGELGGPLDFSGRVAVVTGGTRGVGRSIVEALLAAGSEVFTCGRHEPGSNDLPYAVGPDGTERAAGFLTADVREADQARAVVESAAARHGRLDLLVNNAGGSPEVAAADASPRFIASIVSLNLLAPFYCAQAANAVLQGQADGGSIVNIGSVSGLRPSPGTAAYGAAKAGLVSLTGTLAVEWAPKVRVNCVSAGLLDTGSGPEHYGGPEGLERVAGTVPLGRMGVPGDVAGACLFLASPLAAYVSGANLVLHGGGEWPAFLRATRPLT